MKARRIALAAILCAAPFLAARPLHLVGDARLAARRLFEIVRFGQAPFGPSTYDLFFAVAFTGAAVIVLVCGAASFVRERREKLGRPVARLRALYLFGAALGPFVALMASLHLSPMARGRTVLASSLARVLEHQAALAFAAAAAATLLTLATRETQTARARAEHWAALDIAPVVVPLVIGGLGARVLGQLFREASMDAPRANALESASVAVLIATLSSFIVTTVIVTQLRKRRGQTEVDEDLAESRPSLARWLARGGLVLALPMVSLAITCWSASRPCEPDGAEIEQAPVVAAAAVLPLPLAREGAEPSEEGVWLLPRDRPLAKAWPKGSGTREVRLVVQRDAFERGASGVFARFGTPRLGVLRIRLHEREHAAPECVTDRADAPCLHVATGAEVKLDTPTLPSVLVIAQPDDTVEAWAQTVARARVAILHAWRSTAEALDVEVAAALAPKDAHPGKGREPKSKAPATPAREPTTSPASAGCAVAHAAATFEAHDLHGRQVFLTAAASEANGPPRPLVIALHGAGGSPDDMRDALGLEAHRDALGAVLYLAGRAHVWDLVRAASDNADVAFVDAAIAWAESERCVDRGRRFAIGYSMGGYLATRLACDGRFRGIVTHAAGGPYPFDDDPDPLTGVARCKPLAALVFHGANDPSVPLVEGRTTAERWRTTDGCSPEPVPRPGTPCVDYAHCAPKTSVALCVIPGFGHDVDPSSGPIVWDFLEATR